MDSGNGIWILYDEDLHSTAYGDTGSPRPQIHDTPAKEGQKTRRKRVRKTERNSRGGLYTTPDPCPYTKHDRIREETSGHRPRPPQSWETLPYPVL